MQKKLLKHVNLLVMLSAFLTFICASIIMYYKFDTWARQGVRDEVEFLRAGIEEIGETYIYRLDANLAGSRITLIDAEGEVLFDSNADTTEMENHKERPEFIEAQEKGYGETTRYSSTLAKQTFYYAVRLESGNYLRVAKTTDSMFVTMISSFMLLAVFLAVIFVFTCVLVSRKTKTLIEPINNLNLENPLENVCYEELRPLLVRVDQQNKEIARQVEKLKEAESVRREFSANVSHELKTPLMSISGYAELMMNGMVSQENVPRFSGRIYKEASRLTNLVADIIQISRLDEKSDMPFEKVDLYELTKDVVFHLQVAAAKKHITLEMKGEEISVEGVRHVLYEMLFNVADNAVRYTEDGGKVTVFVGIKENRPYYYVEDNGIGIPLEEQKRIFERFYRVDKSHSRQTGGTGLGLSIVKHGAMLHHAEIHLQSAPGEGTKMELLF